MSEETNTTSKLLAFVYIYDPHVCMWQYVISAECDCNNQCKSRSRNQWIWNIADVWDFTHSECKVTYQSFKWNKDIKGDDRSTQRNLSEMCQNVEDFILLVIRVKISSIAEEMANLRSTWAQWGLDTTSEQCSSTLNLKILCENSETFCETFGEWWWNMIFSQKSQGTTFFEWRRS